MSFGSGLRGFVRTLATIAFLAILAGLVYAATLVVLGHPARTAQTGISIDTGGLRADPGTPVAVLVNLAREEPAVFGWTDADGPFDLVITHSTVLDGTTCFDVVAGGGTNVVQVDHGPAGWMLGEVARNVGPNAWETIRGATASCLDR
jgi:hypothetical protein